MQIIKQIQRINKPFKTTANEEGVNANQIKVLFLKGQLKACGRKKKIVRLHYAIHHSLASQIAQIIVFRKK